MKNKLEIRVIYHIGMYTGQRLKDCVLLRWGSINLERRRIWVKQFKTGKEVTIPIADKLFSVLMEAKAWQCNDYVCPNVAVRYNHLDKNGKNIGNKVDLSHHNIKLTHRFFCFQLRSLHLIGGLRSVEKL